MHLAVPFAELPDEARVRIPVAISVTALSRSGLYAKAAAGKGPPIERLAGSRTSVIRVGELRRFLADPNGYTAPRADEVAAHAA